MTTPPSPHLTSPRESRPTLPQKHSSRSLSDVKPVTTIKSPTLDGHLSASSPTFPQTPSKPLPQRLRSYEGPRNHSVERSSSIGARSKSPVTFLGNNDEPRQLIVKSYAPRVAVHASTDTDDLVKEKGFNEGLRGLLRPYGESIQGRVIVRDSIGSSKTWDDFAIRIVGPDDAQPYRTSPSKPREEASSSVQVNGNRRTSAPRESLSSTGIGVGDPLEKLMDHQLRQDEVDPQSRSNGYIDSDQRARKPPRTTSSVYPLYLRKLFSSMLMVPYETFCHPVSCIIAVSSHNPSPIETLRYLYAQSGKRIPAFVGAEYLRYYVLIHDEERDDMTKSTALFDLMKRHFGLHCHLLRLRSSHCVQSDDDSTPVPPYHWLPPEEDLGQTSIIDYTDESSADRYIFDSDATAIRSFLREMVSQSIVPFMENRVMTWNDQVASRRRGLSGRFMSISKRWAGFGSRNSQNQSNAPSMTSNYDPQQGFYPPDTPEATMRTLADYAFMLRDFRLAYSTYEFLRSDFAHDKAWAYHAAANEMAAVSYLLIPQPLASSKSRSETVDNMLDTAVYSYLTRCSLPYGAIRTLTTATELLSSRGAASAQDAARWSGKLLEVSVLSPTAQAFLAERMAECYRPRNGAGVLAYGSRRRQTALWSLIAAQGWARIEKPVQARRQLKAAQILYSQSAPGNILPFQSMKPLWTTLENSLEQHVQDRGSVTEVSQSVFASRNTSVTHVESEQMNQASVPPPTSPGFARGLVDPLGVGQEDPGGGTDGFE